MPGDWDIFPTGKEIVGIALALIGVGVVVGVVLAIVAQWACSHVHLSWM